MFVPTFLMEARQESKGKVFVASQEWDSLFLEDLDSVNKDTLFAVCTANVHAVLWRLKHYCCH